MNKNILNTGVQEFIKNNWNTDIVSVLFKKTQFHDVSPKELVEQLEAKKKCNNKLPTWFVTPKIYYPNKLNIEQTSSEETAIYKSKLVRGKTLVDLTGGFGVDSYFFAEKVDHVIHCEVDQNLSKISAYNAQILGTENIDFIAKNGIEFIRNSTSNFDWIFIDPSRRDDAKQKVFLLKDCIPNVPSNLELLFQKTQNILIKTSPLLDISQGISELKSVKEIHVVAVKNEVKELLFVLHKGFLGDVHIKTVNLKNTTEELFEFWLREEQTVQPTLGTVKTYLYEPNVAILKAGAFKVLGNRFGLQKLHQHSHLYTSDEKIEFPGRIFKVQKSLPYSKKGMKQLGIKKANITTRNFPISVQQLRKTHKIKDGGDDYLFFTKDKNDSSLVLLCKKA